MRFVLLFLGCLLSSVSHADSLLDRLSGTSKTEFLKPDQAFSVDVVARDAHTLQVNFHVTPGYYLYRDKVHFTGNESDIKLKEINLPTGEIKQDPNFGEIAVFHRPFQAQIILEHSNKTHLTLNATYQGCSDQGLCYPPIEKLLSIDLPKAVITTPIVTSQTSVTIPTVQSVSDPVASIPVAASTAITHPAAPVVADDASKMAALLKGGNFWIIISFFFGAGLLLALTPCVFPMIPILSGIIVGRGEKITHKHAFLLSLAYVLGMAVTYALAGVVAGLTGDLISNALQTPAVLGSFAAVFVLLSLSMFGFYELQLPTVLQSKLSQTSNQLHGGHLSSVFVMGALSAVIMGPCVAAPLAAALLYIGQSHDAFLGGVALFALALGMGAPLLLVGASAGALLPKAGAWMEAVKRFFGVLMLALAIWIVQSLLPMSVQMLLWATLLIISSSYLHVLDVLPHNATGLQKFQKGVGTFTLLLGIAYLIGALSGAKDILRPLAGITDAHAQVAVQKFERIKDVAELEQRLAQSQGKVVMLDFYADWCVSCKEMERNTFSNPTVQTHLNAMTTLQIDMTQNSAADKDLLKRFGLYGPPAILFFDKQGHEITDSRVVGYQDAPSFLRTLKTVLR
ncbi:MAG: protein-disulfide reductase DsbD [Gallionella sp.]|nr:protein-disulfide reductase DsbD [Gallionella sp.]